MKYTPTLARLIDSLRCLPGVGPKSAQRMAFYLLERDRDGGRTLSQALAEALQQVGHCKRCRMLTESELCSICASTQRDSTQLCVVESPADVVAIEQSGGFRGRYFVLMGHLSPLDGVGPAELGLDEFEQLLQGRRSSRSDSGDQSHRRGRGHRPLSGRTGTAPGLKASRIAHGVPVGGELEYVDGGTLAHALAGRTSVS